MPTTIDSLQIEIQSNSTSAASGIKNLAASLGELKKQGAISSAVKNLNALTDSLKGLTSVEHGANKISALSRALSGLKNVGSIGSIVKNLSALTPAVRSLSEIDTGNLGSQLSGVAAALKPLSEVKASGFTSAINSLKKLNEVTKNLDDEAIDAFGKKIAALVERLEPLSRQMTSVQAGLKGINSAVKTTNVTVQQANANVNVTALNLNNVISVAHSVMQALRGVAQGIAQVIDQATQWDGISARFGRGFGEQAEETYRWVQRLNQEMGINIQQFMQYSSVYATMLTGFGVANEDAAKMALGYTELTYDIWAGYNDIYRTFDEAAEAVRSAIAGEVEPVRRAGFTIIESTLQQTAANHGLSVSLETATEAQKSYLRYLTLVDQAHSQGLVGTYSKEMNTAEGLLRTLSQQVKSLAQSVGSLFLPILVKVLPYVQAFVEILTEGVHMIANFFGVEIQPVDWGDYSGGIGNATSGTEDLAGAMDDAAKSAKALKNATIGMDELNVISPNTPTSGSGGGGAGGTGFDGLDVDSLWDESIFDNIQSKVDEIKERLKGWLPVIEAIGIGFAGLAIAQLLKNLGDGMEAIGQMDGKLAALKKTLVGLSILTIEAVLVFVLSDEYLETGNAMALIGEALATAAGGYLMYRGFGAKGAVLAMGVSIIAQLASITLNLADGGVEMRDPQLWIQSAFTTALAGATGGWMAYKGLIPMSAGKGIGIGLLAGASLTLAAITIGEITANGEVTTASIFTGLGSVLAAAGFGLTIGGPWGAAIGAAVGLAINVVGAVVGGITANAKQSVEEELRKRFGEIELSEEMLSVYVDTITAIPRKVTIDANVWNEITEEYETREMTVSVSAALEIFTTESATLDQIKAGIESAQKQIDRQNLKIALGMEVDPKSYTASIETFVSNAQEYLDQYYLTTSIALEVLGGDAGLKSTLSEFYTTNSARLSELGTRLKKTISEAFVDGEWIPDKLNEALEIQKEMQEILDYASDVEYLATMQNLKLSISGDALTPDSFSRVLKGAQEAIESKLETLEEVKMSSLQVAIMEYDAHIKEGKSEAVAQQIYKDTVEDIEREYQNGIVEVTYGTIDFGISTLHDAFEKELDKARKNGWFNIGDRINEVLNYNSSYMFDNGSGEVYSSTAMELFVREMAGNIELAVMEVAPEVRESLSLLLAELEPTEKDYKKAAKDAHAMGVSIPKEVRKGLNDINELRALTKDTEAINYLIGKGFSTDPVFLNTLATAKGAGKNIDKSVAEGLLNNLDYVTDESGKVIIGIRDSMNDKTIELTPQLVENMKDLGVDLSAGLKIGAEGEMKKQESAWRDWAIWPWNWFKQENEMHSPSKLFQRGGKNLVEGLMKGIGDNPLSKKLSAIWSDARTWWNEKKPKLKEYTPSIGSIFEKLSERWTNARTWWNEKKTKLKEYTPSIGSIYEKLSERWKNAREWWNDKKATLKSYTPSIGSIKDKLVSAWNSAKSWWNNNVKLSIPSLSFKVTYTNQGLNWAQKGIVSALGLQGWPKLSFAANGGIFDQGSMIWAGEHGAEIVANAGGGKTGVMNVQQMQDAVYEGVYAAIVAGMRAAGGSDGSQAVNIYLDSRQITAAVEQRQRERGASIMGNQVYGY